MSQNRYPELAMVALCIFYGRTYYTYCSVNPACLKHWILCVSPKVNSKFWLSAHSYFVIKDQTYLIHSLISVRHVKNANPADHKSVTWNTIFFSMFLQFCKKNPWIFFIHKWPFYHHFWSLFCQLHLNFEVLTAWCV